MPKEKILFLLTLLILVFHIKSEKHFIKVSGGPTWLSLNSLEKADYILGPLELGDNLDSIITRNTDFKIKRASGFQIDLDGQLYLKKYLNPFANFTYSEYSHGEGFLNIFNNLNGNFLSLVEYQEFQPFITARVWHISNIFKLYTKRFDERKIRIELLLGYNSEKATILAKWQEDTGITYTCWRGFQGGLRLIYNINKKNRIGVYDYIYPDKLNVTSTKDSLLGTDAGSEKFLLLGNTLIFKFTREILNCLEFETSFEWFYATNKGKAKIKLTDAESADLTNPRLCFLHQNIFNLLFGFNFLF